MTSIELKLCDIQGRLFVLAGNSDYDSISFIDAFMSSSVADSLDESYNRMQWAGEEYLLEDLADEKQLKKGGTIFSDEALFWIGYIYRYWHILTGEPSKKIVRQASPKLMNESYLMFHTMSPEMAIEDLKEIYRQRTRKKEFTINNE